MNKFSDLQLETTDQTIGYPILDSNLSFSKYIENCRQLITERRSDLQQTNPKNINNELIVNAKTNNAKANRELILNENNESILKANRELILNTNSPYELYPQNSNNKKIKSGVLLIHGLLDCPFSFKEIALQFQSRGILCKSILLPGHGTKPEDLLSISYKQWIQTLKYGIENLKNEVDKLYIAGFSTGAALAVWHALQDKEIAGIILLAPAIKIKISMPMFNAYQFFKKYLLCKNGEWINKEDEVDYAKYISIPFNSVKQVDLLTQEIKKLTQHHSITCPIFMCASNDDETISTPKAINFFQNYKNQKSKLILYTNKKNLFSDKRIITRPSNYPSLQIKQISHVCIPFSLNNFHYGQNGDYAFAALSHHKEFIYAAYDPIEIIIYNKLHQWNLIKTNLRVLTYNPDFDFMMNALNEFFEM